MTAAVELRTRLKQISDPVPSFNDMVVKASASALRELPRVNGAYRDGKFELYESVNIGIAVAARTRSSCRRCSTPTRSRSARSPATRAR